MSSTHISRAHRSVLFLLGVSVAGCATIARADSVRLSAASLCRPADATTGKLLTFLKRELTATATEAVQWRSAVGITTVDTTRTVVITDATLCQAAADQYVRDTKVDNPNYVAVIPSTQPVYVVQVGHVYGVVNPTMKAGEWQRVDLMTYAQKKFTTKTKLQW